MIGLVFSKRYLRRKLVIATGILTVIYHFYNLNPIKLSKSSVNTYSRIIHESRSIEEPANEYKDISYFLNIDGNKNDLNKYSINIEHVKKYVAYLRKEPKIHLPRNAKEDRNKLIEDTNKLSKNLISAIKNNETISIIMKHGIFGYIKSKIQHFLDIFDNLSYIANFLNSIVHFFKPKSKSSMNPYNKLKNCIVWCSNFLTSIEYRKNIDKFVKKIYSVGENCVLKVSEVFKNICYGTKNCVIKVSEKFKNICYGTKNCVIKVSEVFKNICHRTKNYVLKVSEKIKNICHRTKNFIINCCITVSNKINIFSGHRAEIQDNNTSNIENSSNDDQNNIDDMAKIQNNNTLMIDNSINNNESESKNEENNAENFNKNNTSQEHIDNNLAVNRKENRDSIKKDISNKKTYILTIWLSIKTVFSYINPLSYLYNTHN